MKFLPYFLLIIFGCVGCKQETLSTDQRIQLHKLKKRFVIGDFDGDVEKDTVFQHHYSHLTNTAIEYAPDPFQHNWETVIDWFHEQEVEVYLTFNKKGKDTLHLGLAQGLYCLINIGGDYSTQQEAIALVVDHLDFSRLNSCQIYLLCDGKWRKLKQFEVHESAFDFMTDTIPVFKEIEGYLEKQRGEWFFMNHSIDGNDCIEGAKKMEKLHLDQCP